MKIILVSFADSRFLNSLKELESNTNDFPFYERYFLTELNSLTKDFWIRTKPWLYRRGYGYWSWKAPIVYDYLSKLNDDDILVYSDAGNYWNSCPKAIDTFNSYLNLISGDKDILVFNQHYINGDWTKGDIFDVLGLYNDKEAYVAPQCFSGMFFIRKTPNSCTLVEKWVELSDIKKELITDKASKLPNKKEFKENRHDQSLFSTLLYKYDHAIFLPESEVMVWDGNWDQLNDKPIHTRRLIRKHSTTHYKSFVNILTKPLRYLLYLYFRYIRNYHYLWRYMG